MTRARSTSLLTIICILGLCLGGCSDDDTPSSPDDGELISQSYAPIDTLNCPYESELVIYDCDGVRVYGDMLRADFELVRTGVSDQLVEGEVIRTIVDFRLVPTGCIRTTHPVGDVSASTCDELQGSDCLGGRYFNFEVVDGGLEQSLVGEWPDD